MAGIFCRLSLVSLTLIFLTVGCKQELTQSTSATTTPVNTFEKASLVISFNRNPIPYVGDNVSYVVKVTETNGVGVSLKNYVSQYYSNSGPHPHEYNTKEWFESWVPGEYLPANGSLNFDAGAGKGWTYATFTINGIDDNGNDITATGRVDFVQ
jgi:hypothetical protein